MARLQPYAIGCVGYRLQQGVETVPLLVLFGINKTFQMYEGTHAWTYYRAPRTKLCMVGACDTEIKGPCFKCDGMHPQRALMPHTD